MRSSDRVAARLCNSDGRGSSIPITVRSQDDHLLLEAPDGTLLDRWPFVTIEEMPSSRRTLRLMWPPQPQIVELELTSATRDLPWMRQLHSRAHRPSLRKAWDWIFATFVFALVIALLIPIVAAHIPWRYEAAVFGGLRIFPAAAVCHTPKGDAAFEKLITRLFPIDSADKEIPLEALVIRNPAVNAFAFLAARVFVFDGLIREAKSPDELAGVLAHELEHVKRRHVTQTLIREALAAIVWHAGLGSTDLNPSLLTALLKLKFSRDQEREADEGGLQRLVTAKVSVNGFKQFFERAAKKGTLPEVFSDHPAAADRSLAAAPYLDFSGTPTLDQAEWQALQGICGRP